MKIYVESLSKYNAGRSKGEWVDIDDMDEDDLWTEIKRILDGDEEYLISDTEDLGNINMEHWIPEHIIWLKDMIKKHDEIFLLYFKEIANGYLTDASEDDFEDRFHGGPYDDKEDYVSEFLEDTGTFEGLSKEMKNFFETYLDYERIARDWEISGDIAFVKDDNYQYYVFSNH